MINKDKLLDLKVKLWKEVEYYDTFSKKLVKSLDEERKND